MSLDFGNNPIGTSASDFQKEQIKKNFNLFPRPIAYGQISSVLNEVFLAGDIAFPKNKFFNSFIYEELGLSGEIFLEDLPYLGDVMLPLNLLTKIKIKNCPNVMNLNLNGNPLEYLEINNLIHLSSFAANNCGLTDIILV